MMVSVVFLALTLVASTFSFPFSNLGSNIGNQGSTEVHRDETQTGINTLGQTFTQGEKTGLQGTPIGFSQTSGFQLEEKSGVQGSSPSQSRVETTVPVFNEGVRPVAEISEPIRVQNLPETYIGQFNDRLTVNPSTNKVETVQAVQTPSTQGNRPFVLPVQPLSVIPSNQDQVLTPVVVPAEVLAAGRLIIMAVEPIRRFLQEGQDRTTYTEKVVPAYQTQPAFGEHSSAQYQTASPVQQVYSVQQEVPVQIVEQGTYQQKTQGVTTTSGNVQSPLETLIPVQQETYNVQTQDPKQAFQQQETQSVNDVPAQTQNVISTQQQVYAVQPNAVSSPVKQVPEVLVTQQGVTGYVAVPSQTVNPYQQHIKNPQTNEKQSVNDVQTQVQTQLSENTQKSTAHQKVSSDKSESQSEVYENNQQQSLVNSQTTNTEQKISQQNLQNPSVQVHAEPDNFQQAYNVQQATPEKQASHQQFSQPDSQEQIYKEQKAELNQQQNSAIQPPAYNYVASNSAEYVVSNFGQRLPQNPTVQSSVQNFSENKNNQQQQQLTAFPQQQTAAA